MSVFHVAPRELDLRVRALGADHHRGQQRAQLVGVARLEPVARGHELGAELRERADRAGPQQRHQVVELAQVVLHRRRGEQQQVARAELVDELPAEREVVAQPVRLVDDHEVEADAAHARAVARVARRLERGDDQRMVAPSGPRRRARRRSRARTSRAAPRPTARTATPGVSTSAVRICPRSRYSLRMMPASIVLPRPTSSASRARPPRSFITVERGLELVREALDAAQRVERQEPVRRRPRREPLGAVAGGEEGRSLARLGPARDERVPVGRGAPEAAGLAVLLPRRGVGRLAGHPRRTRPRPRRRRSAGRRPRWRGRRVLPRRPRRRVPRRCAPKALQLLAEDDFEHVGAAAVADLDDQADAEARMDDALSDAIRGGGGHPCALVLSGAPGPDLRCAGVGRVFAGGAPKNPHVNVSTIIP